MTTPAGDGTSTPRSRLLPQGVGVVADVAAVAALLAGGGRPIVWAASLGAVLTGAWLLVRRLGQPLDATAVVGLAVAVAGAGIFGYSLRPSPPPGTTRTATTPRPDGSSPAVGGPTDPGGPATRRTDPAAAGQQTWVADLAAVDGGDGWRHGSATVAATVYERSVIGTTCSATADEHESFDLGRRFTRFRATVGLADDAANDARTRFTVEVDGAVLFTRDLRLGATATVDVPVTGRGRLVLKVGNLGTSPCGDGAVWGDPTLR